MVIEVGQFCNVLDSSYAEYGVKKGDVVYIAGDTVVSTDEKDPYALRRLFIAAWMVGTSIDVNRGGFTIDGKRLKPLSDIMQERLNAVKDDDFEVGEVDEELQEG